MLFQLFGDGLIMTLALTGIILILLIAIRANIATYFIVMIPLFLGFAVNTAAKNYIDFPQWIYYAALIILGMVFAAAFIIKLFDR